MVVISLTAKLSRDADQSSIPGIFSIAGIFCFILGSPMHMFKWHLWLFNTWIATVFELGVHEGSEIVTGLPHSFTKEGLLH